MIVHIGKKTPIGFGVTTSKVKVTITLKLKTVYRSLTLVPFGPQYSNFIG
jgi:hypothetical protein